MVVEAGEHVKIVGGSTHLDKAGVVSKKTKVMASLVLDESGISVSKKHKFLEKIDTPVPVKKSDEDKDVSAKSPSTPIQAPTNDILVTVPLIDDANMRPLLKYAKLAVEDVVGKGAVQGNGLMLRGMGQIKFKLTNTDKASDVVSHFKTNVMVLDGQTCMVSFAEPAAKHTGKRRHPLCDCNHRDHGAENGASRSAINQAALPAGRSLHDRLTNGPDNKKFRGW